MSPESKVGYRGVLRQTDPGTEVCCVYVIVGKMSLPHTSSGFFRASFLGQEGLLTLYEVLQMIGRPCPNRSIQHLQPLPFPIDVTQGLNAGIGSSALRFDWLLGLGPRGPVVVTTLMGGRKHSAVRGNSFSLCDNRLQRRETGRSSIVPN